MHPILDSIEFLLVRKYDCIDAQFTMREAEATTSLLELGWRGHPPALPKVPVSFGAQVCLGRVAEDRGILYVINHERGQSIGECSPEFLRSIKKGHAERPVVGDWVVCERSANQERIGIQSILPRRNRFVRRKAGTYAQEHVLATNIDDALVVTSVVGDFNVRRLERYLAVCMDSQIRPTIVLSKADLRCDREQIVRDVQQVASDVPVLFVSAKTGEGMPALQRYLQPGQTVVLLGSSGVGKSALINAILGTPSQATQGLRSDGRGRHTTTSRQMIRVPQGGLVVDSPGIRELGLIETEDGIRQAFADIDEFARGCRFRDCMHIEEPGCLVRAKVRSGELEESRLSAFHKLDRELEEAAEHVRVFQRRSRGSRKIEAKRKNLMDKG